MVTKGYFIITDISGYTEYLTKSELEHAHETLQGLFDAQLAQIKFPLHISGFRGDAAVIREALGHTLNDAEAAERGIIPGSKFTDAPLYGVELRHLVLQRGQLAPELGVIRLDVAPCLAAANGARRTRTSLASSRTPA